MKTLAIVLVGGAAKIAADGISGVLALLRLYIRPKGRTKIIFFCLLEYPWKDEASGLLLPFSGANRGALFETGLGLHSRQTAKKRKSKSEFRCGFLFEEKRGGARFRRRPPVVRPCPGTRVCVKSQAESADDGGGCMSALNGPIDTLIPRQAQPSHHGGEDKQQTHGGLLGTKLKD